jgi:hypothetical protein
MPTSRKRAKKPSLKRDKPIRSWSKVFGEPPAAKSAKSAKSPAGTVADGVRLGYQVIDDYLTKGQEAARNIGGVGGETLKAASGEVQRLTQRMLQYASDLASAWMELLQTMTTTSFANEEATAAAKPSPGPGRRSEKQPPAAAQAQPDASDQPCSVSLEIESPLPTETTVDLRRRAIAAPVDVQPLSSDDPRAPRIIGVTIEPLQAAGRVLVRLRVPPAQPTGLYRGLIIERATNLPCGTMAIRVGASGGVSSG